MLNWNSLRILQIITIIGYLLIIHLAFDAYLRPDKWLGLHRTFLGLVIHSATWSGAISLALYGLSLFTPWNVFFLAAAHFLIDARKCSLQQRFGQNAYLVDQFLHVVTILITLR
ncbi:MAG: DUF3307 domain-containing protein [Clostridia bacterium]|nr:DUF3307 domain-containing protein [Clostridia bacterium]